MILVISLIREEISVIRNRYGVCKYKLVMYGSTCTFDNFKYFKI